MRTRYADGVLTGAKQWITNGSYASTILAFAREGADVALNFLDDQPAAEAGAVGAGAMGRVE